MGDHSDLVARDVLVRDAAGAARGSGLRLKPRAPWVLWWMFGSCGLVVAAPITMFLLSGELRGRELPIAWGVALVGYALLYAAAHAVVNRASVTVMSGELCFVRGPLWPFGTRRVRLADLRGARIRVRPSSLRYPLTYRGYPTPQPYWVELELADGATLRLPTTLGLRDAEEVARFVESQL